MSSEDSNGKYVSWRTSRSWSGGSSSDSDRSGLDPGGSSSSSSPRDSVMDSGNNRVFLPTTMTLTFLTELMAYTCEETDEDLQEMVRTGVKQLLHTSNLRSLGAVVREREPEGSW